MPRTEPKPQPERRAIPDLPEYEVDAMCSVFRSADGVKVEITWPYAVVDTPNGRLRILAPRAAAEAFVPETEHLRVFEAAVGATSKTDRRVRALATEFGVSPWVILELARVEERDLIERLESTPDGVSVGDVAIVEGRAFASYRAVLAEPHRPPSKGGNTRALHRHLLEVDGHTYSWHAVGAMRWAFVGDRVSFRYTITPEGFRNVLPGSFTAVDGNGAAQVRGDRSYKAQLRTSAGSP